MGNRSSRGNGCSTRPRSHQARGFVGRGSRPRIMAMATRSGFFLVRAVSSLCWAFMGRRSLSTLRRSSCLFTPRCRSIQQRPARSNSSGYGSRVIRARLNGRLRRVSPVPLRPCEGPLIEPTPPVQHLSGERVFVLRAFGRLPVTDSAARSEGRRPKSLGGGNRGRVCGGSGVGLWGLSTWVCPHLSVSNGDRRLSNHHGVGFGRRVQDRNGGLVVSGLRFGGRRRR